jgi:hypothetical protein
MARESGRHIVLARPPPINPRVIATSHKNSINVFKRPVNVAFTTTEGHNLMCTGNEAAAHEVALDEEYVFKAYEDTPVEVL